MSNSQPTRGGHNNTSGRNDGNTQSFSDKPQSGPEDSVSLTAVKSYDGVGPIDCDMELAELWSERARPIMWLHADSNRVKSHHAEVAYRERWGKRSNRYTLMSESDLLKTGERMEKYQAEIEEWTALMKPIEDKYADERWTRFFLVRNSGGHIHSSMSCSQCYPTTEFFWLPDRSGSDEAETVALAGDGACSFCFPSAPVVDRGNPKPNQLETADVIAARAARQAAKEAKAAKELATGIWAADGGELREAKAPGSQYLGQRIKTERTAEIMAVDAIVSDLAQARRDLIDPPKEIYPTTSWEIERQATYDLIIPALASKRGQSVEEVDAFIRAKAQKKFAKEYR
jgi:hypothetical protein